ncbi:MAG: hypothetical protein ACI4RI_00180 [Ruminococcus sp.]
MRMKRLFAVMMAAIMMMTCVTVASAANSPSKPAASFKTASVVMPSFVYNAKTQRVNGKVTVKVKTSYGYITLKEGVHYKLVYKPGKYVRSYKVSIVGIGAYAGTSVSKTYKITKASNKVTVGNYKKSYKASSLKKKATTFKLKIKGVGVRTCKASVPSSLKKYIKVGPKGKVTLKKGAKKGTYKIVVKCAGTYNYKSASKTITIKVK